MIQLDPNPVNSIDARLVVECKSADCVSMQVDADKYSEARQDSKRLGKFGRTFV